MAASKSRNEDLRVQPEFKCDAIPNPAPFLKPPPKIVEDEPSNGCGDTKTDTPESFEKPPEKAAG